MLLAIEIPNEKLAKKIVKILEAFRDDGVRIIKQARNEEKIEGLEEDWREIVMNTHSADIDDDEFLYEAAWEYYNEKHSD